MTDPIGEDATGGRLDLWEDLALAIRREVAAWAAMDRDTRPNLILNLSVGWDAAYGDPPVVRATVEDAVCRGALVVAAAGNRIAGPAFVERPIFPAAWEAVPAPSRKKCERLLGESLEEPAAGSAGAYRPLLHAVGGVQHDGRPLSNSRPGATPRLVAYGDHVPVRYRDGVGRETLTGTSVSTLVVTAAAAARWRAEPRLESYQVMQALWNAGEGVEQAVDFCLGGACAEASFRCPTRGVTGFLTWR